jgi:hypothetical protein
MMANEAFILAAMLGSTCMGLVWGWLIGSLGGRVYRLMTDCLALCFASILLAIVIFLLTDLLAMTLFLGASGLALFLHLEWRRSLSEHFGPPRC